VTCFRRVKRLILKARRSIYATRPMIWSVSGELIRASVTNVMSRGLLFLTIVAAIPLLNRVADAQTLQTVRDRGSLLCGLSQDVPGFSSPDDNGRWSGLDVDFCRAVAATVLRDPAKVTFVPLSDGNRLSALRSGQIDLLARVSTFTLFHNMWFDTKFVGTTYFSEQGFLVRKSLNVKSAIGLKDASICLQADTPNEERVTAYIKRKDPEAKMKRFDSYDDAVKAYESGHCDAIAASISELHASRLKLSKPHDHVALANVISKDPQGPVVRYGDSQWSEIVKWVVWSVR
jgi:general L-amino acid transport system substrate-binding protein